MGKFFTLGAKNTHPCFVMRSRHADDGPEAVAATALIFLHETGALLGYQHTYDERIHADNYWRLDDGKALLGQLCRRWTRRDRSVNPQCYRKVVWWQPTTSPAVGWPGTIPRRGKLMAEGQFLAGEVLAKLQLDASQYLRGLQEAIARTEQFQQRFTALRLPDLRGDYRRGRPG